MKRIFSTFVVSVLFLFLFSFTAAAQQKSERWVCLNAGQGSGGHTAKVSVKPDSKPLPNSPTYVFECIGGSCTTGSSNTDLEVFGKDNLSELVGSVGYQFQGSTLGGNPVKSDTGGNIGPFEWTSATPQSYARRWLALNYFEPPPPPPQANEGGQQQGTFQFETLVDSSNCVSLAWDPYGRVFDSKTLEPIKGAKVELHIKRSNGIFSLMLPTDLVSGKLVNPQVTQEDGGFSFVVPDGTYKLVVVDASYAFPGTLAVNANNTKIYSDLYPVKTGNEIVQKGEIQHRDIPVDPKTLSRNTPPKMMEYFYDLNKLAFKVVVNGRVSHPFAKINAYSVKPDPARTGKTIRYRLLTPKPVVADKFGKFRVELSTTKFEAMEVFGELDVQKVDLTKTLASRLLRFLTGLISPVEAQQTDTTIVSFEPILNYLEGYAYGADGMPMSNATVGVNLSFSNKPSYTTKADEKGYFRISSEFLPTMPYSLVYTSMTGEKVAVTLSRFLSQNTQSMELQKINPNSYKNQQGKMMTQSDMEKKAAPTVIPTAARSVTGPSETNRAGSVQQSLTASSSILLIIAVLLALILILLVIIGAYLLRNKQQPPIVPPTV